MLQVYRVELATTNSTHLTGIDGDPAQHEDPKRKYIDVEGGFLYVVAPNAWVVGRRFPWALKIERIGIGMGLSE